MRKSVLSLIAILMTALLLCSCFADPNKVTESDSLIHDIDVTYEEGEFDYTYNEKEPVTPVSYNEYQEGGAEFACNLLKASYQENCNTAVAPASAYLQVSLLANGSVKAAKNEILDAVGNNISFDVLNESSQYFQSRLAYFTEKSKDKDYTINMQNNLWCNDLFNIKTSFLKTDAKYYGIDIYRFLFSEDTALNKINNATLDYTEGGIAPFEAIDENAYIYATSFTDIQDNWLEDYAEKNISTGAFKGLDGDTEASYYASSEFYIHDEEAQGFIKSFKNTPVKLCVILPNENISIKDYINNFSGEKYVNLVNSVEALGRCNAYLPGFSVQASMNITSALKNMGINTVFSEEAIMSNMTQKENIHINEVVQGIEFSINEKGISSDEIKEKQTSNSVLDNDTTVKADRPFIYAVIDNESNIPIYLGVVENI